MCRERCRERGSGLAPEQEAEKHGFAARLELGSKPNEKRRAIFIARRFHVLLADGGIRMLSENPLKIDIYLSLT